MSYTSAQSGDNYRNWWPHPTMTAFCNDSIDLMEKLARDTNNLFAMTGRGYALATRNSDIDNLLRSLQSGIDVDVVSDTKQIRQQFPALSDEIMHVLHVKRGGDFSSQQLGTWMLEQYRAAGGRRIRGEVSEISKNGVFHLHIDSEGGLQDIKADVVINAAGPYAAHVSAMLGTSLPVKNIYQQKIAFEDSLAAIPRDMPFSIDLDEKSLGWNDDERELLAGDAELEWLTGTLPAGTHCRPDGGERGKWVKLGWAYNTIESEPQRDLGNERKKDSQFPEIVIRGAAALIPSLKPYIDSPPMRFAHYGGYYTMTEENWPLIGAMKSPDTYVVGALSGFGSMAACAAGRLCAASVCGSELPGYAQQLGLARYDDEALMQELLSSSDKGLL